MKENVDEVYREGAFEKYIGNDIFRLLGLSLSNKVILKRDSIEKCDAEVNVFKKSFASVLKGTNNNTNIDEGRDRASMLKPLTSPRIKGAMWWWKLT